MKLTLDGFTVRYCCAHILQMACVSVQDEFEALGFVLLDVFYGMDHSPLNPPKEVQESKRPALAVVHHKQNIVQRARQGEFGSFFKQYFHLLDLPPLKTIP